VSCFGILVGQVLIPTLNTKKKNTLTFEAVSVLQMTQFGACVYSLWKAIVIGEKKLCPLQVGNLKPLFQKCYYLWLQYDETQPPPSHLVIKVININPGGLTVRCVTFTLFQCGDTFLGLMCT
jgi:hypothetical protein